MKKKVVYSLLLIIIALFLFFGCRHELPLPQNSSTGGSNQPPPTNVSCSPDSVYFVNEIQPIISSNCTMSGCHDNISHADGVNLTTYAGILKYVVPGNASNSKLYNVIIRTDGERMPPPPMAALSQGQRDKIIKWINQGAKNNICISSCDSNFFTYSGAVKITMQNKCVGCHNPTSLGGNIDLSTYTGVKTAAQNGKLYGSVAHQPGYSPMPKNSAKLTDCEIRQIQKWIAAGSLNN